MDKTLIFKVDGVEHEIELADAYAPKTLAKVLANTPATIDIHCAKIAGSHIMWPTPFVERAESAADVLDMQPGSFFFWPERQYLEITYDALQAETASVSYLGRLKHGADWLRDYADRQRRQQGRAIFTAQLYLRDAEAPSLPDPEPGSEALRRIRGARIAVWKKQPAEVDALLNRRGLNIPYGPLSMAEGELRKLHELLWRLWNQQGTRNDAEKAAIASFVLEAAITRVGGFCHMLDSASVFQTGIDCLAAKSDAIDDILVELILYTGRMAAWLDLHICWQPINELTLQAYKTRNGS
jgi:hypothetical protein